MNCITFSSSVATEASKIAISYLWLFIYFLSFFKKIKKNYFWLCWILIAMCELSLVVVSSGSSLVMVLRLLIAGASLVAESSL